MVGGKVIGVSIKDGESLLNVQDKHGQTCAVRAATDKIKVGDEVWWQCGKVMWTPQGTTIHGKCGKDFDIQVPKIGYSH